jgi:hypothetical protein
MTNQHSRSVRRPLLALAVAATGFVASAAHAGPAAGAEQIEISSPIFPRVLVLYASEGIHFPATLDGETTLAHDASITFDTLLTSCAATHPAVTLASVAHTPTSAELATNYNEVAECAYTTYTVKPYWIPQLVDDVDICGTELGAGWRLPTEADVASMTEQSFTFIADTLTSTADAKAGASFWGTFYFSLSVFVRAGDGSIQKADLSPGQSSRIAPLSAVGDARKSHYEGGVSLRCIRRTAIP